MPAMCLQLESTRHPRLTEMSVPVGNFRVQSKRRLNAYRHSRNQPPFDLVEPGEKGVSNGREENDCRRHFADDAGFAGYCGG